LGFLLTNIAPGNTELANKMIGNGLNILLKDIGDEWYRIPLIDESSFPDGFRYYPDDASIWNWGLK